jgi:hypothetical protein
VKRKPGPQSGHLDTATETNSSLSTPPGRVPRRDQSRARRSDQQLPCSSPISGLGGRSRDRLRERPDRAPLRLGAGRPERRRRDSATRAAWCTHGVVPKWRSAMPSAPVILGLASGSARGRHRLLDATRKQTAHPRRESGSRLAARASGGVSVSGEQTIVRGFSELMTSACAELGEAAVLSLLAVRVGDGWAAVCGSLLTVPAPSS